MATPIPRRPKRLWPNAKYDMHTIACGAPMLCRQGPDLADAEVDYTCSHASFLIYLRRFAGPGAEDVVFRAEPAHDEAGEQIGFMVQFFWQLMPSRGDRLPDDFHWAPDGGPAPDPQCTPYVRPMYKAIPPDMRAPAWSG